MACWGLEMELVVAGICCLLKIGIDGGGIVWESWLLVVTNLKRDTGNNEICTQGPRQDDGKAVKAQGVKGGLSRLLRVLSPHFHICP